MSALTVQQSSRSAPVVDLIGTGHACASGGDTFANTGVECFQVQNAPAGSDCVITIAFATTVDGQSVTSRTVTVATGKASGPIGPFNPAIYGSTISLTYSQVVGCTISVFKNGPQ